MVLLHIYTQLELLNKLLAEEKITDEEYQRSVRELYDF